MFGTVFVSAQQVNFNFNNLLERDEIWFKNNPDSLPIWLTQEELLNLDKIGKNFQGTSPPPSPVRMPAEFEPMQGVLIRYPFGISYDIIAEMSEDVIVVTIVASTSEQSSVYSQYQSHGVNVDNCEFLIAPSNSYWTRDYGPWFVFNGDDEQGIVDHIYNRPRPLDDAIPIALGNWLGIPDYSLPLEHTGGNYMTDGQGIAISTDLVWSDNSEYSHQEIDELMQEYCGINNYMVVPDALGEYIKHIDCWAKLLSPDIIMIIKSSTSHSHYQDFEDAAEYFENQTSCYGTPFKVVRIYTHLNEPYINSLVLNNKVLMPITGSQWDDDAISSYEAALPGYEVLGFTGSWQSTDALHCRTKGIVDRYMLYIEHTPLHGTQSDSEGYTINTTIHPYSGEDIINISTGVYWKTEGDSWDFIELEGLGDNQYCATIPPQETGTIVYYYIHAEDNSGRSENHPYIGADMAYSFDTYLENNPPQAPTITGPSIGNSGSTYDYKFNAIDPEENEVRYHITWGDGYVDVTDFGESGSDLIASHSWNREGNFTITAYAEDNRGLCGPESTLTVTMPRNKITINNYIKILLDLLEKLYQIYLK
jgi:agmatine/peptidylarginine deiminase